MGRLNLETPIGRIVATSAANHLISLHWVADGACSDDAPDPVVVQARIQLADWFAGRRRQFDLPLDLHGTAFQRRVWTAMAAVPFGATVTYRDLALEIGSSPRAIGTACGRNPLPIIIPCHRVLATGGIGGYSGGSGLPTKRWLLEFEARVR